MRVNIYGEELTDRVEVVQKFVNGKTFFGLRFYLYLPATVAGRQYAGPFLHGSDDDDSAAVTFWADTETALMGLMRIAYDELNKQRKA